MILIRFFTSTLANSVGIKYFIQILNLKYIVEFSNVARYKVNTQKSVAFPYTDSEQSEKGIKTIPLAITSKRIKYFEINQGGERLIQ